MSRVFDYIHRKGIALAERRAMRANPDYADRHAARRVKPGLILGSEGPGGLEGFFADMDLQQKYRAWWHIATLKTHWWMEEHGPRATRNKIRDFWQRGKRGWADSDTWNLDSYLSRVISDALNYYLADDSHLHGHPGDITYEEWKGLIKEMAEGMDAHLALSDILIVSDLDPQAVVDLEAKRDLAFDHFKKRWGSLWD